MQHANILGCIKPQAVLDTFADGALAHGANHSLVDLLALYQAGDCLLISPAGSRLGQGVACALDADEWRRETTTRDEAACALSKKVQALLRQASAGPSFSGRPVVMFRYSPARATDGS